MIRTATCLLLALVAGRAAAAESVHPLQPLVDQAVRSGARELVLPAGEHRSPATLQLRNASGLTLRGAGAVLVNTAITTTALAITGCREVAVEGLTVDYDPLPFTQGVVTAVDGAGRWAEVAIDDGYPSLGQPYLVNRLHLFTPDGSAWKPGTPDLYASRTEARSPRLARSWFSVPQPTVAAGDRAALNIRADYGIAVRGCPGDVTLRQVRIRAAPGLAVLQRFCRGRLVLDGLVVERGPVPAGATAGRLLSSAADGVNVAYGRIGPVLRGCDLAWMGDDGLNIHGVALPVVRVDSPTELVVARPYGGEAWDQVSDAGDPVRVLAPGDFAVRHAAALASITRLPGNPGIDPAQVARLHYKRAEPVFWRVVLAAPAPLETGGWIDLPAVSSPGWWVMGSRFHDHRGRGLRVMASRGTVAGNVFERIKQAAISVGAEYGHWREAGWLEDVTVTGNLVVDAFTGPVPADADYAAGAIAVFARLDRTGGPYPAHHRRIAITGNTILGSGSAGILAYAVRDLQVADNRIEGAAGVPAESARIHGLPTGITALAPAGD